MPRQIPLIDDTGANLVDEDGAFIVALEDTIEPPTLRARASLWGRSADLGFGQDAIVQGAAGRLAFDLFDTDGQPYDVTEVTAAQFALVRDGEAVLELDLATGVSVDIVAGDLNTLLCDFDGDQSAALEAGTYAYELRITDAGQPICLSRGRVFITPTILS